MPKPYWKRKRIWILSLLGLFVFILLSNPSVQMILKTAPDKPRSILAQPSLNYKNQAAWENAQDDLRKSFQETLYGSYPNELIVDEVDSRLSKETFGGIATIEFKTLRVKNPANSVSKRFGLILVKPASLSKPSPLILTQNFCPNHDVVKADDAPLPDQGFSCEGSAFFGVLMHYFFGRYIVSPPFQNILEKGYAIGVLHPPEFIPDHPLSANEELETLFSNYTDNQRPGALMAWAAQAILTTEILKSDTDIGPIIHWGHSRYGKVGLLAAAHSENIQGVIAHQSGTAGASLSRGGSGETLLDILNGYPHWLGSAAFSYAPNVEKLPFDQHHLIGLVAPRPILLGNARRDVWSDPEGAFRAGRAASNIYGLYDSTGLTAERLGDFRPKDDISFWIRPGTHGVVKEDWPAFLKFLESHFPLN